MIYMLGLLLYGIWAFSYQSVVEASSEEPYSLFDEPSSLLNQLEKTIPDVKKILTSPEVRMPTTDEFVQLSIWQAEAEMAGDNLKYEEVEKARRKSLSLIEQTYGKNHIVAAGANSLLGDSLTDIDRYIDAEFHHRRAFEIRKRVLGINHQLTARSLNNLAKIYNFVGQYPEAKKHVDSALEIQNKIFKDDHLDIALSLYTLASIFNNQGIFVEAEAIFHRVLAIREKLLEPNHELVISSLNALAAVYQAQGRLTEAEFIYKRVIISYEKLGLQNHPLISTSLENLGLVHVAQNLYNEAEVLLYKSLNIRLNYFGTESLQTAMSLNSLAGLFHAQGRYPESEKLLKKSFTIYVEKLGPQHPLVATLLGNLAGIQEVQGNYSEMQFLLRNSLAIREKTLGQDHPLTVMSLSDLAFSLHTTGSSEALSLARRALSVSQKLRLRATENTAEDFHSLIKSQTEDAALVLARATFETSRLDKRSERLIALRKESFEAAQLINPPDAAKALARGAVRIAAGTQGLDALVREWERNLASLTALDREFTQMVSAPTSDAQTIREKLMRRRIELNRTFSEIDKTLRTRFPAFSDFINPDVVSIDALQARVGSDALMLGPDEALILITPGLEAKSGQIRGLVFAVTKEGAAWADLGMAPDHLKAEIIRLHATLNRESLIRAPQTGKSSSVLSGGLGYDRKVAKSLYDALFSAPEIAALIGGKSKWLLAPQGVLLSLPYAALVTGTPQGDDADPDDLRRTPWLGLNKALALIPSVSSLRTLRTLPRPAQASRRDPFFGFGDPALEGQSGSRGEPDGDPLLVRDHFIDAKVDIRKIRALPSLPWTATEIKALAKSFGVDSSSYILGLQARESALWERARDGRLGRARVIVLATHGLMAGQLDGTLAEPGLGLLTVMIAVCRMSVEEVSPDGGYGDVTTVSFSFEGSPLGSDEGFVLREGRRPGRSRSGQPFVCRGCFVDCSDRGSLA